MTRGIGGRGRLWLLLIAACLLPRIVAAETRRALIIGIDAYVQLPGAQNRVSVLQGAENDAQAIKSVLLSNFGFQEKDIVVLRSAEAVRSRILDEIRRHLIAKTTAGDLRLFFFAGHGSWLNSDAIDESDGKAETIVPADANHGVPDIEDKQLRKLFEEVTAQEAELIAIFDSCHSGSITRGLPMRARVRSVRPGPAATAQESLPSGGEIARSAERQRLRERHTLVLSAAQSQDTAVERVQGEGQQVQGVFTNALVQVLRSPLSQIEPARLVFQRTRALMKFAAAAQEPHIDAAEDRKVKTFLAGATGGYQGRSVVTVSGIHDGILTLQGGHALGLQAGAELSRLGPGAKVRVQVTQIEGMAQSLARTLSGPLSSIKPGDAFIVENYGPPQASSLRIFIPRGGTHPALLALARELAALEKDKALWVSDPTLPAADSAPASHTLSLDDSKWVLRDRTNRVVAQLAQPPRAAELRDKLRQVRASRLFVELPLPGDVPSLQLGEGSPNSVVKVVPSAQEADYILVGRISEGRLEYAWIIPGATSAPAGRALPARSEWLRWTNGDDSEALSRLALRLNKVKSWLTLTAPHSDEKSFPYRLVLRNQEGQLLGVNDKVRDGEEWRPQLLSDNPPATMPRRYVYLFSIDSDGCGRLIFPTTKRGSGENSLPDPRNRAPRLRKEFPLGESFTVQSPFGLDTMILVINVAPIESPDAVFTFDGVRKIGIQRPKDPLSAFLFDVGENRVRGETAPQPPTDWSIQRVVLESIAR